MILAKVIIKFHFIKSLCYRDFLEFRTKKHTLSNFKIGGPNLQNGENKGTKTAIKPLLKYKN
jgi:hypothetical protein